MHFLKNVAFSVNSVKNALIVVWKIHVHLVSVREPQLCHMARHRDNRFGNKNFKGIQSLQQ